MKKVIYYIAVMYQQYVSHGQEVPFYELVYKKADMSHIPDYKGYFESYSKAENAIMELPKADPSWKDVEWSIEKAYVDE